MGNYLGNVAVLGLLLLTISLCEDGCFVLDHVGYQLVVFVFGNVISSQAAVVF